MSFYRVCGALGLIGGLLLHVSEIHAQDVVPVTAIDRKLSPSPCTTDEAQETVEVVLEGEQDNRSGWLRLGNRHTLALEAAPSGELRVFAPDSSGRLQIGEAQLVADRLRLRLFQGNGPCRAGAFELSLSAILKPSPDLSLRQRLARLYSLQVDLERSRVPGSRQDSGLLDRLVEVSRELEGLLGARHPLVLLAETYRAHAFLLARRPQAALELIERLKPAIGSTLVAEDQVALQLRHIEILALSDAGRAGEAASQGVALLADCDRALGSEHPLRWQLLSSLAEIHLHWRDHGRAQQYAELAHAGLARLFGPAHVETLAAGAHLAAVLYSQHRAKPARELLEQLGQLAESSLGFKHHLTLRLADLRARSYYKEGRWREGLALAEDTRARAVREFPANEPMIRYLGELLAWWYRDLGRNADAEALLRDSLAKGLDFFGAGHPSIAETRTQLALVLLSMNQPAAAYAQVDQALRQVRTHSSEENDRTLWIRGIRAQALDQLGRAEEALAEASAVARGFRALYGSDALQAAEFGLIEGRSLARLGRTADALRVLEEVAADEFVLRPDPHPERVAILAELAAAQRQAGNPSAAIASLQSLFADTESLGEGIGPMADYRQSFLQRWAPQHRILASLLVAQGEHASGFDVVERIKARGLLESLSTRLADGAGLLNAEESARLGELGAELSRRDQILGATQVRAPERAQALQAKAEAARALREYREALGRRYPKYAQLMRIEHRSAADLAEFIAEDTAFVSYAVLEKSLLVFAYTRDAGLLAKELSLADGLLDLVRAYRALLAPAERQVREIVWQLPDGRFRVDYLKPEPAAKIVRRVEPVARRLSEILLAPVARALRSKKRWIVSPDESLALLPIEALPWLGGPVVMRHEVSYIQSLSVLALLREARPRAQSAASLFAMGNPVYARPDSGAAVLPEVDPGSTAAELRQQHRLQQKRWLPLPETLSEVMQASGQFGPKDREIYFGPQASEANLQELNRKQHLARHRYLLFATHASLNTEAPQLSAVVLAQDAVTRAADGYVTAAEWIGYNLDSELIVLSGCETALATTVRGEGVTGLPYALLIAGNRKTLLSLWKVYDDATAKLIPTVFKHLQAGHSAAAALTLAKRALRQRAKYRSPQYWAPFVLYGG